MFLCHSFNDDSAHISHTNEFMPVILVDFCLHLWLRLLRKDLKHRRISLILVHGQVVSHYSDKVRNHSLVLSVISDHDLSHVCGYVRGHGVHDLSHGGREAPCNYEDCSCHSYDGFCDCEALKV